MELKHHLLLFLKFSTSTVWHKLTLLFFCALEVLYQGCSQLPSHVETLQGKKWFPAHCFLADFSCSFMTEFTVFPGAVGQAHLSTLPLSPGHLHRLSEHSFLSCQSQQKSLLQQKGPVDSPLSWLWHTYPDNVPSDQMKENLTNSHSHFTFRSGA